MPKSEQQMFLELETNLKKQNHEIKLKRNMYNLDKKNKIS